MNIQRLFAPKRILTRMQIIDARFETKLYTPNARISSPYSSEIKEVTLAYPAQSQKPLSNYYYLFYHIAPKARQIG
jgi:hypothetical protein